MWMWGVVGVSAVVGVMTGWALRSAFRSNQPTEPDAAHSASVLRQHIGLRALDLIDTGVVVADGTGTAILQNAHASQLIREHPDGEAPTALINEMIEDALTGNVRESEVVLPGHPQVTLTFRSAPIVDDTGVVGAVVWADDISSVRRVDQIRRDFVANVSHELKTPIGALTVLAESLTVVESSELQRQLTDRMVRETERLGQLVEDLLSLSLIEAELVPERQPVNIAGLVNDAVDAVSPTAEMRHIKILVTLATPTVVVSGNARQLGSAIVNLLDNAIKYSDDGATISVSVQLEEACVVVAIADQGIGIPAEDLERIFERFYRVDRARSRATGGTGLGLSIVRHVVQAHGGEVRVVSEESEGSCFSLMLPQAPSNPPQQEPESIGAPR